MAGAIAPLIDKTSPPLPAEQLQGRGVLLDQQLPARAARRVARQLPDQARGRANCKRELPQLKTFCTLSPIPGFARWLRAGDACDGLPASAARRARWPQARRRCCAGLRRRPRRPAAAPPRCARCQRRRTRRCCAWRALYLALPSPTPAGDPVARFHLDNGARLERLNAQRQPVGQGPASSRLGLMVNYLYDLARIETSHDRFAQARWHIARAVGAAVSRTVTDGVAPTTQETRMTATSRPRAASCCAPLPRWPRSPRRASQAQAWPTKPVTHRRAVPGRRRHRRLRAAAVRAC